MWNRLGNMVLGSNLNDALVQALRKDGDRQALKDWYQIKSKRLGDTARMNFRTFEGANGFLGADNIEGNINVPPQVYAARTPDVPPAVDGVTVNPSTLTPEELIINVKDRTSRDTVGRGEALLAQAARYPVRASAAIPAVYLADQFLGQPIGGTVDALTLGLTNFKEDEVQPGELPYTVPRSEGYAIDTQGNMVPNVAAPVPALSEKDLDYQIRRQQQMVATNSITLRELERMRREAQFGVSPMQQQPAPTYYS